MTCAESTDVPWTVNGLTALGFAATDAKRLASLLPPIEAGILVDIERGHALGGWPADPNPAAALIWFTHDLGARQARDLARMGRGVLDLVVILDAVRATLPGRIWDRAAIDVAREWASERIVARSLIADYIAAGVRCEEAARFEAAPATRPSMAQLRLLAALRK
ncbi:hypothetical protein [Nocardioides sp. LS1]|uniref:hypothetical protein n=1 Tax=Nocardioides sp. LS1 TaxID=1027620 RepID=UPI000F61BBD7|nr:hypothetical protein [Nocardioides sp. LS1]GCD90166.1 hypothetical protein NLS1_21720 [Nocardioides sp. LS1]